jgi:hypothetical protein
MSGGPFDLLMAQETPNPVHLTDHLKMPISVNEQPLSAFTTARAVWQYSEMHCKTVNEYRVDWVVH